MAHPRLLHRIIKFAWPPRFGLRTLLILVALFGAGFGYLGHLYRRVQHQRQIVARIEEAGGTVHYSWQFGFAYVDYVGFIRYSHPLEPVDPKTLLELPRLKRLTLVGPQVSDEWLAYVAKIPQLQVLALSPDAQSTVTPRGLAKLRAALPQCQVVRFDERRAWPTDSQ